MAKKTVEEIDPVAEQKAQAAIKGNPADAIDDAALHQTMRELRSKLDIKRTWSQGDMIRRYQQVMTMLEATMARYEQDILQADETAVTTKSGG